MISQKKFFYVILNNESYWPVVANEMNLSYLQLILFENSKDIFLIKKIYFQKSSKIKLKMRKKWDFKRSPVFLLCKNRDRKMVRKVQGFLKNFKKESFIPNFLVYFMKFHFLIKFEFVYLKIFISSNRKLNHIFSHFNVSLFILR